MKCGNSPYPLTMTSHLGPVATPLHIAPTARPVSRGVHEEAAAAITTLQPGQIRAGQEQRRGPRDWPKRPRQILSGTDPPPAISSDRWQHAAVILPLRKDAVESPKVAIGCSLTQRLRPKQAVDDDPKPRHSPPRRRVIHPLREVGAVGKVDAEHTADVLLGLGHVTNITSNGGYSERMMDDGSWMMDGANHPSSIIHHPAFQAGQLLQRLHRRHLVRVEGAEALGQFGGAALGIARRGGA